MASKQDLRQSQAKTQDFKQLGTTVGTDLGVLIEKLSFENDVPLKMAASFPTANAVLNFSPSTVIAADLAKKVASPVKKQVFNLIPKLLEPPTGFFEDQSNFTARVRASQDLTEWFWDGILVGSTTAAATELVVGNTTYFKGSSFILSGQYEWFGIRRETISNDTSLTIDFQTQIASSVFDIDWPTNIAGQFRRAGFTLIGSGKIKVLFSLEAATQATLANAGSLFVSGGLPIGYIDLVATSTSAFKSASAATNIIVNNDIYRFGAGAGGGGGAGDANSFTENLKHRLMDSYFEFVTPCVFETDELTLIQSTTASLDIVDGVMSFTAAGQNFVSDTLFCPEFLASNDNSRNIEVHAEWFDVDSIDIAAIFEVTTDGTNYFTVPMTRQGLSTKFTGSVKTGDINNVTLRLRVTSSAAGKLKAFGVFYCEKVGSVIEGIQALQKITFNGSDNENEFTLTNFLPNPSHLKVYDLKTGQVYRYGAFSLSGKNVIFPVNTFLVPDETVELLFDQSEGTGYDYSDENANLLASNHLGSSDNTVDKSLNGRGILIRNALGELKELWLDESNNLNITNPKG